MMDVKIVLCYINISWVEFGFFLVLVVLGFLDFSSSFTSEWEILKFRRVGWFSRELGVEFENFVLRFIRGRGERC